MRSRVVGYVVRVIQPLVLGVLATVGASVGALVFAWIIDLWLTEGSFRAVVELPVELVSALERCGG